MPFDSWDIFAESGVVDHETGEHFDPHESRANGDCLGYSLVRTTQFPFNNPPDMRKQLRAFTRTPEGSLLAPALFDINWVDEYIDMHSHVDMMEGIGKNLHSISSRECLL
jgi:hypothetical protein